MAMTNYDCMHYERVSSHVPPPPPAGTFFPKTINQRCSVQTKYRVYKTLRLRYERWMLE